MVKSINQQKNQKQSTGAGSTIRKRGKYEERLSPQERNWIIYMLEHGISPIERIAQEFSRNKETIRSIFKNKNKQRLYFQLEIYLINKYLNQFKSQKISEQVISKVIKEYINNQDQDPQLKFIIEEVKKKRLRSANKQRNKIITFDASNRRIIKKMSQSLAYHQLSGETADINNTVSNEVTEYEQESSHFYDFSTNLVLMNLRRRESSEMLEQN